MRYPGQRKPIKAALSPDEITALLEIAPEKHLDGEGTLQPYATIAIMLRRVIFGLGELQIESDDHAKRRAPKGQKRTQRDMFFFPGERAILLREIESLGYEGRGAVQRVLRDLALGALVYVVTKKGQDWANLCAEGTPCADTCREYAINEGLSYEDGGAVECPLCDELQNRQGAECCDACRGA